ncbi:MAG: tRNA (N(6)-L-threonylcarbamoyladenosine(37)-C(2))-methylthiotransferase [Acidilobus sp.]
MGTYYIENYGCALAEFDSSVMASLLEANGFHRVSSPDEADVVIVNTCAVRLDTEAKIVKRLAELSSTRLRGKLIVSGCLVKARPSLVARTVPSASLLSPQNVTRIMEVVSSPGRVVIIDGERDTSFMPSLPLRDRIATVMISEGCLDNCSFCETKLARRSLRSYPPRLIVERVAEAVRKGAKEIRLTGQDVAAYGLDLPAKVRLPELVSVILDKVPGDYRIRIGMMTPNQAMEIIDDLLEVYEDRRVFKFFHIPVQSGDDRVLKLMNRRYTIDEFIDLHRKVKSRYPDSLFATDIIVGHPGEDEEAFERSVELVRKLRFERVYLAQYSIRPRTLSASMPQVPEPVKKERSLRISKVIQSVEEEIYRKYVGLDLDAVVTSRGFREGYYVARPDNYFPIAIPGDADLLGKWVRVHVTDATYFDLRGVVISPP